LIEEGRSEGWTAAQVAEAAVVMQDKGYAPTTLATFLTSIVRPAPC
jgi:hypothetical protein